MPHPAVTSATTAITAADMTLTHRVLIASNYAAERRFVTVACDARYAPDLSSGRSTRDVRAVHLRLRASSTRVRTVPSAVDHRLGVVAASNICRARLRAAVRSRG